MPSSVSLKYSGQRCRLFSSSRMADAAVHRGGPASGPERSAGLRCGKATWLDTIGSLCASSARFGRLVLLLRNNTNEKAERLMQMFARVPMAGLSLVSVRARHLAERTQGLALFSLELKTARLDLKPAGRALASANKLDGSSAL